MNHPTATATATAAHATTPTVRAPRALGARLWHLRLARSPLHANTLTRAPRLARQPRVHPRLSAELISHSVMKKPESLKT